MEELPYDFNLYITGRDFSPEECAFREQAARVAASKFDKDIEVSFIYVNVASCDAVCMVSNEHFTYTRGDKIEHEQQLMLVDVVAAYYEWKPTTKVAEYKSWGQF